MMFDFCQLPIITKKCTVCEIAKNCNKSVQKKDTQEKIYQCIIANNLLLNGVDPTKIWLDKKPSDPKIQKSFELNRHFEKNSKIHLLRTKPKIDIVFGISKEDYSCIEIKYFKNINKDLFYKIDEVFINGDLVLFVNQENFFTIGQLFTDLFKIIICVAPRRSKHIVNIINIACYYCFSESDNSIFFEYIYALLNKAYDKKLTFIILNEKRHWYSKEPITPIWHGITFRTKCLRRIGEHIEAEINILPFDTYETEHDLRLFFKKYNWDDLVNFVWSFFHLEDYSKEIATSIVKLRVHKMSSSLLVFTANS